MVLTFRVLVLKQVGIPSLKSLPVYPQLSNSNIFKKRTKSYHCRAKFRINSITVVPFESWRTWFPRTSRVDQHFPHRSIFPTIFAFVSYSPRYHIFMKNLSVLLSHFCACTKNIGKVIRIIYKTDRLRQPEIHNSFAISIWSRRLPPINYRFVTANHKVHKSCAPLRIRLYRERIQFCKLCTCTNCMRLDRPYPHT